MNAPSAQSTASPQSLHGPRVPPVPRDQITDVGLRSVLEQADRLSAPKPEWYLTLAHNPDVAKGFSVFWETTYREGRVDHVIKELMRLTIVQLVGCDFCSGQRSVRAEQEGLDEADVQACALPDFNPPDPRTRAAVRYARALALDEPGADASSFDEVYADLRAVFDDAEVIELAGFAALALGGAKVARSLRLL